tara:strand:- start:1365 stop:1511 length:147 start_codon:yes stop_codon:yes gene_type:complete
MNNVEKNNKSLLQKFIDLLAKIFSIKQKPKKKKKAELTMIFIQCGNQL